MLIIHNKTEVYKQVQKQQNTSKTLIILVCPLFVDLSIIVEITIKSTNKIKYGIAYL